MHAEPCTPVSDVFSPHPHRSCHIHTKPGFHTIGLTPTHAVPRPADTTADITTGPAAPPQGSSHAASWQLLGHKLKAGLVSALGRYPVKGSCEYRTKSELLTSALSVPMIVYPALKAHADPQLQIACEAAMLRLMVQGQCNGGSGGKGRTKRFRRARGAVERGLLQKGFGKVQSITGLQ